jgi:CheY-like chemotaxis protein
MSYALAMVENLFFQARIQAVAKHLGAEVKIVPTGEQLVAEAAANPPALVIVDLNSPSNPLEAIKKIHEGATPPLIIGYLAHTQGELAEQATAAGCSKVMSQGRFTEELPVVLARARGKLEHKSP